MWHRLVEQRTNLLSEVDLTAVGTVVFASALPSSALQDFYFEMQLAEAREAFAAIGMSTTHQLHGMVGFESGTFGFHAFDGSLRAGHTGYIAPTADCCPPGSVMGCGFKAAERLV